MQNDLRSGSRNKEGGVMASCFACKQSFQAEAERDRLKRELEEANGECTAPCGCNTCYSHQFIEVEAVRRKAAGIVLNAELETKALKEQIQKLNVDVLHWQQAWQETCEDREVLKRDFEIAREVALQYVPGRDRKAAKKEFDAEIERRRKE